MDAAQRHLIAAAVRAAVVAPRDDVERWFAWPAHQVIAELVDAGTLVMPARGWLAFFG
jgi:hypothetical protein